MSKKILYALIAPILVIIIMCICFAINGIFPFGSKTVAWCDLSQQTIPLLMNFKDVLEGKSSLFYSASSGGGINFFGVFLFFLASPFYLAVKFIEKQDMIYFVNILLVLKLAVCAFTSSLYFSVSNKKLDKKYIVLFGLIYAFCGYGFMYYQTLVWLDIMYLFPLLVLSVDRLCIQKKPYFFIIMLSANIIVNYYLSFMTVIYLIISVTLYIAMRCKAKDRKNVAMKFILSAAVSALITAPIWLCSLIQVSKSARSINNLSKLIYAPVFEYLKDKLCIIGADAFIFAALFFIIKNPILKKSKVKYNLLLLFFLIIPIFIDPINKMWHGGGYQSFPLRFGYMIIFTALIIVSEIIQNIPENKQLSPKLSVISFIIMALISFISVYVVLDRKKILSGYIDTLQVTGDMFKTLLGLFFLSLVVCILYFILLRKKLISSNIFFILASCVIITEVFVNMSVYVGYASNNDNLFKITANFENKIDENQYYRVKSEKKYLHVNMIGAIGLNSYAHYTSLTPEDYIFAMKKMGYSSYWMEVGSNDGTILTDSLLGIKYSLGVKHDFKSYQKDLNIESKLGAAENLICAPAGIISDINPEFSETLEFTDRFNVQCQLAEHFFGTDNMLKKYEISSISDGLCDYSEGKYNITASESDISHCRINYNLKIDDHKTLYFDLFDNLGNAVTEPIYKSVKIFVNGNEIISDYPNKSNNGILNLGEFENEDVEILITFLKDVSVKSFGVFGIDIDKLESSIENLKTVEPVLDGNKISLNCSADKNEYLYLAVPWDSGFKAYLNGNKTELYKVNDSFCAIKLSKGTNNVILKFFPEGLKISAILSISGIILAVFIYRKESIFNNEKVGTISYILCKTTFAAVIVFIYVIPTIVYAVGWFLQFGV